MDKGDEQESSKKTRDLPNLSECHACGFRIDSCTGNEKIQILYSEWRIVLLCIKCLNRIESSKICSYCLKETDKDFLTCSQCNRSVHRNCVLKCKAVASLSNCESLICVDCWVPKSLVKRRDNCTSSAVFGNSAFRVSNAGGSCVVERNVVCALMAGTMKRTSLVPRRNVLEPDAQRDVGDENLKRVPSDDDAELAFQLHRCMNSSPRISKNFCVVNSSASHVLKKRKCDIALTLGGSGSGSCSTNALKSSGDETSTNFDSRSSRKKYNESTSFEVDKCSGKLDRFFFKYRKRTSSRFLLKYRRRSSGSKAMVNKSDIKLCNLKPDRYLFKYRRRGTCSNLMS